jgi:hypothetical protein
MVFVLPAEFRAPSKYKQEESDEEGFDEKKIGRSSSSANPPVSAEYI